MARKASKISEKGCQTTNKQLDGEGPQENSVFVFGLNFEAKSGSGKVQSSTFRDQSACYVGFKVNRRRRGWRLVIVELCVLENCLINSWIRISKF